MKAKILFQNSAFVTSAASEKDFLLDKPGVLFVGRSNAGKSTLINALAFKKDLMRVANMPGKTRLINYALIDETFYLIDCPGYGFERNRDYFTKLMDTFFQKASPMLKAIVVVVDARRGLLPSDQDMESYANSFSIPLIYAFTKTDKLNKSQIRQADEKFVKDHPGQHPVFVSTSDHNCYQILRDVILKAVLKK